MSKTGNVLGHLSEGGMMLYHSIYPPDATSVWVSDEGFNDSAVVRFLTQNDFRPLPLRYDTFEKEFVRPFSRWAWRRYVKPFPWKVVGWLYRHRILNVRKSYSNDTWHQFTSFCPWPLGKRIR